MAGSRGVNETGSPGSLCLCKGSQKELVSLIDERWSGGQRVELGKNEMDVKLSRVLRYDNVKDDLVYILKGGNILNKVWDGVGKGTRSYCRVEICLAATWRAVLGDGGDSDAGTPCCGQQDAAGSSDPPPDPFLTPQSPSDGPTLLLVFFFLKVFLTWTVFKVFIEFVTTLPLFYVLFFGCKGCGILGASLLRW